MMTSGKSALRKNRFTNPLSAGYQPRFELQRPPKGGDRPFSGALRHQLRIQYAHVGQVPVSLGEIEPVPDHEPVGDLEADVADGHVDFAPIRLGQESADLQAGRLAGLEVPHQVRECQPRIDDVLDDKDVAALDVDVQVLEDPDHA